MTGRKLVGINQPKLHLHEVNVHMHHNLAGLDDQIKVILRLKYSHGFRKPISTII